MYKLLCNVKFRELYNNVVTYAKLRIYFRRFFIFSKVSSSNFRAHIRGVCELLRVRVIKQRYTRTFVTPFFFPSPILFSFRRNVLRLSQQCKCDRKRSANRLKKTRLGEAKGSERWRGAVEGETGGDRVLVTRELPIHTCDIVG